MSNTMKKNPEGQSGSEIIRITMFGGFCIESGGNRISDATARTHQLWHLIEYLVTFRHKAVSQDELIEALWPGNDIEKPTNALKNLIYRARSALSAQNLPNARELVVFNRGCYQWNNTLATRVDAEEFEGLYNQTMVSGQTVPESLEKYICAINLYKGDFLPGARYEGWAVPIAGRYRSMYFKCVYAALSILAGQCRYEEMEEICKKAIDVDRFEENAHQYMIFSLMKQGKQSQALEHYNHVMDLFFREMGITPSSSIRGLYREIITMTDNAEADIDYIKENLRESGDIKGAFYCEYEIFKNIYRIEARTALRTGQSMFICLLTVVGVQKKPLDVKARSRAMDNLFELIRGNLRKGDVFSRFSATQYVLLLPTLTYENCMIVMNRIIQHYRQENRSKSVDITAEVQPLSPVEILKQ